MMERRAHWSDDLIEAAKRAVSENCFDHVEGDLYDDDIYPVIAAVEDWEAQRGYVSSQVYHGHIDYLQAQIQRVRDWADVRITKPSLSDWSGGYAAAAERALELLDGPE